MIRYVLLFPLAVAGCTETRQTCFDQAARDLAVVQHLIDRSTATLKRGYAVQPLPDTIVYTDFCADDAGFQTTTTCDRVQPVTRQVPVTVDLSLERRKLADLRRKKAELTQKSAAAIRACGGKPQPL